MRNHIISLIDSGTVKSFNFFDTSGALVVVSPDHITDGSAYSTRQYDEPSSDWMIRNLPREISGCKFTINFI